MMENAIAGGAAGVVLPSLNPTDRLVEVVRGLIDAGFKAIIVVNDGSDADHRAPFSVLRGFPECSVLTHDVNRGKGAAMKTAFQYILDKRPEITCAVTVDGDGQHLPEDVRSCVLALEEAPEALILGCRDFDAPEVPFKSRNGNKITRFIFRTGCGVRVSDTQTGLRAVSRELLPRLLDISGDRYEYETNMLLELHRDGTPFVEVPIETVYEDNNSCSHFHPLRDSWRIYRLIIKYMASSFISAGIDEGAFFLLHLVFKSGFGKYTILFCTVVARIISSFCNFNMNKALVFGSRKDYRRAMLHYYCLCVPQMLVSAGLVYLLGWAFGSGSSAILTLLKMAVDTALFFISYNIQKNWVFR